VACSHGVKVTKHVGEGRASRLNNVLVFQNTNIVTGNILYSFELVFLPPYLFHKV
jgi:hypothetical protein